METFVDYLGGQEIAGKMMKSNQKSFWTDYENLTNEFGFSVLPAGFFAPKGFNYWADSLMATVTVHGNNSAEANAITIFNSKESITYSTYGNLFFLAVRCIKE